MASLTSTRNQKQKKYEKKQMPVLTQYGLSLGSVKAVQMEQERLWGKGLMK